MNVKRRVFLTCLGFLIVVVTLIYYDVSLYKPWQANNTQDESPFSVYSGAVHIHSVRSDGSGTIKEIAEAAERTGLDYIVITDHDVGPEARADAGYYGGVLVLVGSEISMEEGHILYIPHPDSLFYEPDSARKYLYELGGAAAVIGAHPFLPKKPLRQEVVPFLDGIEAVNADVQWRKCSKINLFEAFIMYPFLDYSMNTIAHYPHDSMNLWRQTRAGGSNDFMLIGSVDAHAGIKITDSWDWEFPSYERVFRMVQTHVITQEEFNGDYSHDARLVYSALKSGNSYVSFENFGDTEGFSFTSRADDSLYTIGNAVNQADLQAFSIQVPAVDNVRVYLKTPDTTVTVQDDSYFEYNVHEKGSYFAEVYQLRRSFWGKRIEIPWIITNTITIR